MTDLPDTENFLKAGGALDGHLGREAFSETESENWALCEEASAKARKLLETTLADLQGRQDPDSLEMIEQARHLMAKL